jgi:hypothetical protein
VKRKELNIGHRPDQCERCGGRNLHAHGLSPKERRVRSLRFSCGDCEKTHNVHPDPMVRLLSVLKIKQSFRHLVRDFGLLASGLPVNQIKNLTGRKAATIHRTWERCRDEPDIWDEICFSLKADHDFSDRDIDRLEKIRKGEKDNASPFQMAFGKRIDNFMPNKRLLMRRESLRARIERLVSGQVGYASTGEFWRADVDVEQNPWIKQIRAARDDQFDEALLGALFYAIAIQVRNPNQKAQALALERPTAPVMTLSFLCDGIDIQFAGASVPVSLPQFMDGLKEIVKHL